MNNLVKNTRFDLLEHEALTFSFEVEGKIWKTAFDQNTYDLIFEIRDEANFEVCYLLFNLKSQELSDYLVFESVDWWTSLIDIKGDILLLEKYNDPQNPIDKSLIVLAISSRLKIAEEEDFQISSVEEDALLGSSIVNRSLKKSIPVLGLQKQEGLNIIEYPSFFDLKHPHFTVIQEFLGIEQLVFGVEYLEYGQTFVVAYYEEINGGYQRSLLINQNETELYKDIIDDHMNGLAIGAFFRIDDNILFLKNQKQFNAISL